MGVVFCGFGGFGLCVSEVCYVVFNFDYEGCLVLWVLVVGVI